MNAREGPFHLLISDHLPCFKQFVLHVFVGHHKTICKSKNSAECECLVLIDGGQKSYRSLCMCFEGQYIESATVDAKQCVPCGNRPMPGLKTCCNHRSLDQWMSRPRVRKFWGSRCAKSSFVQTFERLDLLRASIEGQNHLAFKCEPDVYAEFCTMAKNMNAIKNAHALDPVIIAETGKVLREVAANGCADFELRVPMRVYRQACAQVKYHKSVALRGRPPKCFTDVSFDLSLEDIPDSVRLRKALLKMRVTEMNGTELKNAGVFELLDADQWFATTGHDLASIGLITVLGRSRGWRIIRARVLDPDTDAGKYGSFKQMVMNKAQMTVEEYELTLAPRPVQPPAPRTLLMASTRVAADVPAPPGSSEEMLIAQPATRIAALQPPSAVKSETAASSAAVAGSSGDTVFVEDLDTDEEIDEVLCSRLLRKRARRVAEGEDCLWILFIGRSPQLSRKVPLRTHNHKATICTGFAEG